MRCLFPMLLLAQIALGPQRSLPGLPVPIPSLPSGQDAIVLRYDGLKGANVQTLYDYSGNIHNGILGTGLSLNTQSPGWAPWGVSFQAAYHQINVGAFSSSLTNFTAMFALRVSTYQWQQGVILDETSGGFPAPFRIATDYISSTNVIDVNVGTGAAQGTLVKSSAMPLATWKYITVTLSGQNATIYGDCTPTSVGSGSVGITPVDANAGFNIGQALSGGNTYLSGDIGYLLLFNRVLTSSEITGDCNFLSTTMTGRGQNVTYPGTITFAGDSLTIEDNLPPDQWSLRYPPQTMNQLTGPNAALDYYNFGIDGLTISATCSGCNATNNLTYNASLQVDPLFNVHSGKNIVVVWGGTNDIALHSATGTDTYNALVSYATARRAVGWKVVVLTMIDYQAAPNQSTYNAERATFNSLVTADSTHFDAIADVASNSLLGAVGAANNTNYFLSDKVHLTSAGCALVAAIAAPAVQTLL